jgi:hypothetical protein
MRNSPLIHWDSSLLICSIDSTQLPCSTPLSRMHSPPILPASENFVVPDHIFIRVILALMLAVCTPLCPHLMFRLIRRSRPSSTVAMFFQTLCLAVSATVVFVTVKLLDLLNISIGQGKVSFCLVFSRFGILCPLTVSFWLVSTNLRLELLEIQWQARRRQAWRKVRDRKGRQELFEKIEQRIRDGRYDLGQ